MYIDVSSLTTFVLIGTSFTNALIAHPGQTHRFKKPAKIWADAFEERSTDAATPKSESFDDKLDDAIYSVGMSKPEKLFQGLTDAPETRYTKLDFRSEHNAEHDLIFNILFAGIKDTLAEVAEGSSSNEDISAEDIGLLRDAAVDFASIIEEAASGSAASDIAARDAKVANGQLEHLPILSIANMAKEFGKIATETAKVVAKVVEDIKKIAHDAKAREDKHQTPTSTTSSPSEPVEDTNTNTNDNTDVSKNLEEKPPVPAIVTDISETNTNKTLTARFIVPGLDPLTITIHVMTTLMAEAGYNYYKNKKAPLPDYTKAAFEAQSNRLADVEQKLKDERAMNAAIKKAHAAHAKTHTHN